MEPTKINGSTRSLSAPEGWNDEQHGECQVLPIRDAKSNGLHVLQSAWQPSTEEIALICAGRPVILSVWSVNHPPVSLSVDP